MKPEKERDKGYENKEKKFITDHVGVHTGSVQYHNCMRFRTCACESTRYQRWTGIAIRC